ncbi:Predicted nuclease of the RNAse H fold, HicB family [Aureimonas altamirensis DSM 21988]|uniref:HicB-like antitoxin of toxin-antitoxin system domain-containing protein n=2 Tax=Aureimonas altamirensis TaxID=370622 RepID=A0A0P0YXF1_9HYPH|nr:type II toxin-antitoxin system HicB family antitoxin [Aureimonas altamirensis]BAT26092.1 hypothetical protein [Aureimonas altamirensis]SHI80878.1 Predicted nuclease of the RNAse H fold, HicB family [Aureimonas altamirensis DSM 21988]
MDPKMYAVVVLPLDQEDGDGFVAYVPDLPGCMSDGETAEEACINVYAAIAEWIEEAQETGQIVPSPGSAARRHRKLHRRMLDYIEKQAELLDAKEQLLNAKDSLLEAIEYKSNLLESRAKRIEAELAASNGSRDEAAWFMSKVSLKANRHLPH